MSNRKTILLGDICEITSSKRVKMADYVDAGVPFYRSKEIIEKSNGNDISTELFISHEHFEKIKSKFGAPIAGDILLTSVGTLGIPYQVKTKDKFYFKDGNLTWFRNFSVRVNPKFLYYWLSSPVAKRKFDEVTIGSTQKALTIVALKSIEIELPSIQVQNHIVIILDSLNSKLSNNRQINQTLEQIAQAIFKSWFIDFEPTRAKVIAKQKGGDEEIQSLAAQAILCGAITLADLDALSNESSSFKSALRNLIHTKLTVQNGDKQNHNWLPEQLVVIADFFPNALVDSELGEIPKGWDCSTLGKHFNVVMGQSPKGDTYNEDGNGMLFFQGRRDFGFRYPGPRVYTTEPKRIAKAGDTLISVRAPVGDRNMAHQDCCLGRGVAGIRHKSGSRSFTYAFIGHIENNLSDNGSDGTVFSSINKNELHRIGFISPTADLITNYELITAYIDDLIEVKENQIQSLIILRDTLLPKLLSGELSVSTKQLDELQNDRVSA